MSLSYQPCWELRNISENKRKLFEDNIINKCDKCSIQGKASCEKCVLLSKIIYRYFTASIPLDFWNRTATDYKGDPKLLKLYYTLTEDVKKSYEAGFALLIKGLHGNGKTYFGSLIVKKFVEKGYSGLYTTLSEVVDVVIHGDYKAKFAANRELKLVDILVIDEFDPRFIGNENSGNLFGKILENVIRTRLQNYMPTILISNSKDPTKVLGDALEASITSLISGYMKEIYVIGKDFRKDK